MVLRNKQNGLTFISLVFILAVIGFFVLVGLRLFPIYTESFKVDGILSALAADPEINSLSKAEIRKRFIRRVDVEDLDRFNQRNLKEYMTITKTTNDVTIEVDYQAEAPLFSNLTIVADFHKVVSSE